MKKILTIINLILVFSLSFSIPAIATGIEYKDISIYQEVLDRLNEEFGTEVSFPTPEDLIRLENANALEDFVEFNFSLTVEEFEASVRADIIACLEADRAALDAVALSAEKLSISHIICDVEIDSMNIFYPRSSFNFTASQVKSIAGGTASLTAQITSVAGFRQYRMLLDAFVGWRQDRDSTPIFRSESYSYDMIDGRRTCAITFTGFTMSTSGTIISRNVTRYVEFYASSA